jgi:hypothetical protein
MAQRFPPQLETQTESSDSKPFGILKWSLWFCAAFLVYLLSIGPAMRLSQERVVPYSVVRFIYAPVDRFCVSHVTLRGYYFRYLRFWGIPMYIE